MNQVKAQSSATNISLDSLVKEMQKVTDEEKAQLMTRLVMIDEKVKKGELNINDALDIKLLETDVTNLRIKRRMAHFEQQIKEVVNAQLEGRETDLAVVKETYVEPATVTQETPRVEKVYGERYTSSNNNEESKPKQPRVFKESRYTDQIVLGFGYNTLLKNGKTSDPSNTDANIVQSRNYEFGLAWKYRMAGYGPSLMFRYGISYMRSHLTTRNELIFVKDGNITQLIRPADEVINNKFTNNYFIAPVHLELDFSNKYISKRTGNTYIRSQKGLRLGVGGYLGVLTSSRQETTYLINNRENTAKVKGDFNVSQLIYGTEAYLGLKDVSIRVRYDLSELFAQNPGRMNVATLGLRWDLN